MKNTKPTDMKGENKDETKKKKDLINPFPKIKDRISPNKP
jgi:hypothetical protein